ncbi:MAG: lysylphosphatidylglycerol synthase transmembrane domain-containing protein [Acidobacteriota bacterium]|nr:flippase-like domain-containing protein [Blastocatellia bacterium]MDW8411925.1 lysylphosphatidylglycerol synthase transmembrane domain-containing protein [Acidobacteriota bacterium]
MTTEKVKSAALLTAKLALSGAILGYIFYKVGIRNIYVSLLTADAKHVLMSLVFIFISYFLGIKRWQELARAVDVTASYRRLAALYFLGLFCNYFLPAGIGGDIVKAYYLGRSAKHRKAFLSVFLDRYVGLLVLLFVSSLVAIFHRNKGWMAPVAYSIWGLSIGFIVGGAIGLYFAQLLAGLLDKFNKQIWAERLREVAALTKGLAKNYRVLITASLLSVGAQFAAILAMDQLSLAVGARSDLTSMFLIVPIVFLASALPLSPGGLGTREAAMVFLMSELYSGLGMQPDSARSTAAAVALLWLGINLLSSLPGIVSYPLVARLRRMGNASVEEAHTSCGADSLGTS